MQTFNSNLQVIIQMASTRLHHKRNEKRNLLFVRKWNTRKNEGIVSFSQYGIRNIKHSFRYLSLLEFPPSIINMKTKKSLGKNKYRIILIQLDLTLCINAILGYSRRIMAKVSMLFKL